MSASNGGAGGSALRQRAAAAQSGQTPPRGVEVAAREVAPIRVQVERLQTEFARAMPQGEAEQFVRDAITCLQTIKYLDRAEPRSVMGALMNCAALGLRPGLLGHAWPLPFWDRNVEILDPKTGRIKKGGYRAQLIIGYQGYAHLAWESGKIKAIRAKAVREADDFDWDEGSGLPPVHRRPKLGTHRGPVIGFYAVVETIYGGNLVHVMDLPEILAFRDAYAPRGKKNEETGESPVVGPWAKPVESAEFVGMAQKTVLRYALKYGPKSPQLARAEAVDETVRVDASVLTEPAAVSQRPALEAGPVEADGEPDPTTDPGFGEDGFRG